LNFSEEEEDDDDECGEDRCNRKSFMDNLFSNDDKEDIDDDGEDGGEDSGEMTGVMLSLSTMTTGTVE